jgi:glutaryl-CoA dehydrogenase
MTPAMAYSALDFYAIDSLFTHEERMIRDTVREMITSRVMPGIGKHFSAGTFPHDLIPVFGEMGLLGSSADRLRLRGPVTPTAYGLICQELERGDSGIRSFCSVQGSLVMYPIWAYGSEEQKQKYLPEMAKGELIGCFGLTEPDFGSNPTGMLTTAKRSGNGFILNGTKRWITNGSVAQVALVWAKLDGKVHGFLVPTNSKGFTARDIHGKWSLRASVTSELIMEDCEVGEDALLPGVSGMRGPLSCLSQARFGICYGAVGAAMACYDEALSYAKDRVQFSRPIAGYPAGAEQARRHGAGDHQGAAALPPARSPQGEPASSSPRRSRSPSATTSRWRATSLATRATSSAPTASPTSISAAATC